jgi:maltoporin
MAKLGQIDLYGQLNAGMEQGADPVDGGTARWIGAGLQPVWRLSDVFSLGGRVELFSDQDGARSGASQTLYNVSVAPAYTVTDGLVLRAELRVDFSDEDTFIDEDGAPVGNQLVGLTEAIYSF